MMVIDADGAILGRMATFVAKQLLLGEEVVVVNAEKAVITGDKQVTKASYKEMHDKGHRYKGPFFPKEPHMIVKRTIRGMLPWKSPKGKEAFKRLKVHISVPEGIEGAKKLAESSIDNSSARKFIRIKEVAKHLGWVPRV